jgi:hypothetical protein
MHRSQLLLVECDQQILYAQASFPVGSFSTHHGVQHSNIVTNFQQINN